MGYHAQHITDFIPSHYCVKYTPFQPLQGLLNFKEMVFIWARVSLNILRFILVLFYSLGASYPLEKIQGLSRGSNPRPIDPDASSLPTRLQALSKSLDLDTLFIQSVV